MEAVAEKKASRIVLLDLRQVSLIADYFLICNGESERQLDAIVEAVLEKARERGISPWRVEGTAASGWMLVDFSALILHLFTPAQRDYYQLEQLWSHARTVAVMP